MDQIVSRIAQLKRIFSCMPNVRRSINVCKLMQTISFYVILRKGMTEESSTASHLSVAMTTEEADKTQTKGESSMTSSSLIGEQFYWRCAVIFIGVVGIAGNALILYALVASKQHKRHMLIVNQNALDLFSSIFLVVTYVVEIFDIPQTGALGYWLCFAFVSGNIIWWGTNGSMVNLAIITIDRYLKVVHPIRSRKWLRPWVIYSAMAFAWFVGIVYNSVLVFCSTAVIDGVCYSYSFFESYAAEMVTVVFSVSFFYFVILALFIFCYWRILVAIRRQASVMANHSTSGSSAAQTHQTQSHQIQTNVVKTMILVSAFYAIAWLPNNVLYLISSTKLVPALMYFESGYHLTSFIAFFYTSANPFIYATKFNPVRQILRKMIPCKKKPVQPGTTGT